MEQSKKSKIINYFNVAICKARQCFVAFDPVSLLLLLLLAFIVLYPLVFTGFTNHDDVYMALNHWTGHTWDITKATSVTQGRFQFIWAVPLFAVPYLFDVQFWYIATKIGSILLMLGSFYYAMTKLFQSKPIAIMSVTLFLAIVQNGWQYNPFAAFPVVYNFYAILFFIAIGLFVTALEKKKLSLAIISGVCYFFSLGVELFILFFPLFIIILISRSSEKTVKEFVRFNKRYLLSIGIPVVIYLVAYLLWRQFFPSIYDGNNLNAFNIWKSFKTIVVYSIYAFPVESVNFLFFIKSQLLLNNFIDLRSIVKGLSAIQVIKSMVVAFLCVRFMMSDFVVSKTKTLLYGMLFSFVSIFIPNILLGFISKHQMFLEEGYRSYIYTYYSFISAVIFFVLVITYFNIKSLSWRPQLRTLFISVVVPVVTFLSFAVGVRNQYVALDQKLADRKWELMEIVVESPYFEAVPNGATIVAPTLATTRGIAYVFNEDWSQYIKYKTGKDVTVVSDKCVDSVKCYTIVFYQESYVDNQFMILAEITDRNTMTSTEVIVYSLSKYDGLAITGSFIPYGNILPQLKINGKFISTIESRTFSSSFESETSVYKDIELAHITGNVGIFPENIVISYANSEFSLDRLSDLLKQGIDFTQPEIPEFVYKISGFAVYEKTLRWTDGNVAPSAKIQFKKVLPRHFTLEIKAWAYGPNASLPTKIRVGNVEKTVVIAKEDVYRFTFDTDGTAHTIEIIPPHPMIPNEADPKNLDTRKLGIGLIYLKILE